MTPTRTSDRIGPVTSDTGELSIWVRQIRGHTLTFWAWPDRLFVYRIDDNAAPHLIRTFNPRES